MGETSRDFVLTELAGSGSLKQALHFRPFILPPFLTFYHLQHLNISFHLVSHSNWLVTRLLLTLICSLQRGPIHLTQALNKAFCSLISIRKCLPPCECGYCCK